MSSDEKKQVGGLPMNESLEGIEFLNPILSGGKSLDGIGNLRPQNQSSTNSGAASSSNTGGGQGDKKTK